MDFLSMSIPVWALLLIFVIGILLIWQFIRFTLRLLLFFILFFGLMIFFDFVGIFSWIHQNILSRFL